MKIKFYIGLLLLGISLTCTAQIVTLRGKITDAKTGEAVQGASILSGAFGTSADGDGNFVFYVQQSVIEESGITASSIGYQTIHLTDITDNYNIKLVPNIQELETVEIKAGAESIVQEAYRKIAENYLDKNFNITGVQRMIHTVRDTFGYQYYYSSSAKVKFYMSPYGTRPAVVQVGLMEKDQDVKSNPKASRINFVNGYTVAPSHDYVHRGSALIKGNTGSFNYKFNREETIDGRKVYVVNFYSKNKESNAGILYIDTATYALVRVLYTLYNVKVPNAIDLDKVTVFVQYRQYNEKWVLDAVKYNSVTDHNGYDVDRTDEFQSVMVTTKNAAELPANAIIKQQLRMVDDYIKPFDGFPSAEKRISKNILKLIDHSFTKPKMPKIAEEVH